MAQVKKGLKGLFSRKKKDKQQSTQPAAQQSAPAAVSQAAPQLAPIGQDPVSSAGKEYTPASDVSGADPVQRTMAGKGLHFRHYLQVPAPIRTDPSILTADEAMPGLGASDSSASPTAPRTTIPQISEPATVSESKNIDLNPVSSTSETAENNTKTVADDVQNTTKGMSKLDTNPPAEGMSATSGPLSDDLVAGYGGSPVENHMRAAHAEKRAQMAESGEGAAAIAEDSKI